MTLKLRILISYFLSLQVFYLVGCSTDVKPDQDSGAVRRNNTSEGAKSVDEEITKQVENFAGSNGAAAEEAWKRLESYPRQDLINSLVRMQQSLPEQDHHRVLIAFVLCNLDYEYQANRQTIISALTREPSYKDFYADWPTGLVIRLIRRGDNDLLRVLFSSAEWADGAMAEELSGIFVEQMRTDPERFLLELKSEPRRARQEIYGLLLSETTITQDDVKAIKAYLLSVRKDPKMTGIANEMLARLPKSG